MPKERKEKKFRDHKKDTKGAAGGGGGSKQGIRFNKDFGQHILKNPMIVTSMIEKVSTEKTNIRKPAYNLSI
jgi:hypothetical protein